MKKRMNKIMALMVSAALVAQPMMMQASEEEVTSIDVTADVVDTEEAQEGLNLFEQSQAIANGEMVEAGVVGVTLDTEEGKEETTINTHGEEALVDGVLVSMEEALESVEIYKAEMEARAEDAEVISLITAAALEVGDFLIEGGVEGVDYSYASNVLTFLALCQMLG